MWADLFIPAHFLPESERIRSCKRWPKRGHKKDGSQKSRDGCVWVFAVNFQRAKKLTLARKISLIWQILRIPGQITWNTTFIHTRSTNTLFAVCLKHQTWVIPSVFIRRDTSYFRTRTKYASSRNIPLHPGRESFPKFQMVSWRMW